MPLPRKTWTVLVYLVAEPSDGVDLDGPAVAELNAIARAGVTVLDHVHVAFQADFNGRDGVFRKVIDAADRDGIVDLKASCCERESTPGDDALLRRFVRWGVTECPA